MELASIHAAVWMNFVNMLSEEAKHQRSHIISFHSYEVSRRGESIEIENRLVVSRV